MSINKVSLQFNISFLFFMSIFFLIILFSFNEAVYSEEELPEKSEMVIDFSNAEPLDKLIIEELSNRKKNSNKFKGTAKLYLDDSNDVSLKVKKKIKNNSISKYIIKNYQGSLDKFKLKMKTSGTKESIMKVKLKYKGSNNERVLIRDTTQVKINDDGDDNGDLEEEIHYQGTATTTIDYYEYNFSGELDFLFSRNYTNTVEVFRGPRQTDGTIIEDNPFHLSISTTSQGEEGDYGIISALGFNTNSGEVLLQYWKLNFDGVNINGTLDDTHIAEAAAANLLFAWEEISTGLSLTYPFPMNTTTKLQGTIMNNQVKIKIEGNSTDLTRPFISEVVADRVN